jgi:hypothetical protein
MTFRKSVIFVVVDESARVFEDKNAVAVIDVAAGTVRSTWSLAPCDGPTGIALDESHHRPFSACHNKSLIVMDSESGKRLVQLPIGAHVDGAAFDPVTSLVFSANGDSADVTVIHAESADQYTVRGSPPTATGAKTMALDLKSHKLYLPAITMTGFQILVAAPK